MQKDPEIAEDQISDYTNIKYIVIVGQALRTMKLIMIIASISYFLGMFWII